MIIYQVLTRLFRSGKFSSFDEEAFNHIKSLGVSHIWYTGIPRHATGTDFVKGDPGSPYAVENYYDVNPYLADNSQERMQEFHSLIQRSHRAGLKVIIDFIPNHVAENCINCIPVHSYCDYDWTDTRKIDYGNPAALEEMCKILCFWAEQGVDGFRLDMVDLVSPSILHAMISSVKEKHPGTFFIGESYEKEKYRTLIYHSGFDLLYDKSGFYDIARGIECGQRSAQDFTWHWQWLSELQGKMLNFLENHDEQRIPYWKESGAMASMAYGALYNNASVMLYFGQELGENAHDGADGRTSIFNWARTIDPCAPLSEAQQDTLKAYRELMTLCASPLFRSGSNWDLAYCQLREEGFDAARHRIFLRYLGDSAVLVVCNFENFPCKMRIRLPQELSRFGESYEVEVQANNYKTISIK